MSRHLQNLGGFILLLALLVAPYAIYDHLEAEADASAEWQQSTALKALQKAKAGSARQQAAGQQLCNEARGPNSEARWLEDGSLVCTTRAGVRPVQVAGRGAP